MRPKKVTKPLDVYVRVSRVGGREGDSYISPSLQEERCRALADARGLKVHQHPIKDEDRSGGKMERPGLDEAIARIKAGESGGIIVARLDRFARTLVGGMRVLEEIQEAGGVVLTAEGDFDTSTATGELVLSMMLSLAQFELRRIKEGWAAARAKAVERGVHGGGYAPAGYDRGPDGRLVPNAHAEAVRQALQLRADGGSMSDVARWLTEAGVPSGRRGVAPWSVSSAEGLLRNRVYLGEARSGQEIVNVGAHEGIVPLGLFRAVQDRWGSPRAASLKGGEGALLAGVLYCESCGGRLSLDTTRAASGKAYRFYRCKHGVDCKARASISAEKVEAYVERLALERVGTIWGQSVEGGPEAAEAEKAYREAEEELAAFVEYTPASVAGYSNGLARRQAEMEAARTVLAKADRMLVTPWYLPGPGDPDYAEGLGTVAVYQRMTVRDKRRVIASCFDRIAVRPGRGEVEERLSLPDAPEERTQAA